MQRTPRRNARPNRTKSKNKDLPDNDETPTNESKENAVRLGGPKTPESLRPPVEIEHGNYHPLETGVLEEKDTLMIRMLSDMMDKKLELRDEINAKRLMGGRQEILDTRNYDPLEKDIRNETQVTLQAFKDRTRFLEVPTNTDTTKWLVEQSMGILKMENTELPSFMAPVLKCTSSNRAMPYTTYGKQRLDARKYGVRQSLIVAQTLQAYTVSLGENGDPMAPLIAELVRILYLSLQCVSTSDFSTDEATLSTMSKLLAAFTGVQSCLPANCLIYQESMRMNLSPVKNKDYSNGYAATKSSVNYGYANGSANNYYRNNSSYYNSQNAYGQRRNNGYYNTQNTYDRNRPNYMKSNNRSQNYNTYNGNEFKSRATNEENTEDKNGIPSKEEFREIAAEAFQDAIQQQQLQGGKKGNKRTGQSFPPRRKD